MAASSREAGRRGLIVVAALLVVVLLVVDLARPDSFVRALLGDAGGPRNVLREILESMREEGLRRR